MDGEQNAITSTPLPTLKKRKIQGPSPTKVVEDIYLNISSCLNLGGLHDMLKRTETQTTVHLDMDQQLYITSDMRAILVDWMAELCYNFTLHRATFHLSVITLDRFISKVYLVM